MQTEVVQRSHWFKREGTADKQYDVTLERVLGTPDDAPLYVVNGWNGRRGGTLKQQPKLETPSPLAVAQAAYDAEVKVRIKKKYDDKTKEVAESGGTYVPPERELVATAGDLQLLKPYDEAALERFITDPGYWAQEKKNGVRLSLVRKDGKTGAFGRDGQPMGFPRTVAAAIEAVGRPLQLDGESCGQTYWVFDAILDDVVDLTSFGFDVRYNAAENAVLAMQNAGHTAVALVPVAKTEAEKRALVEQLKASNAEGVVFKWHRGPYKGGESTRSDDQVKIKFYEVATCRVREPASGRKARVIGLEMQDDAGNWVFVGHATVKANQEKPAYDSFVQVKYLYVHQLGGALVQPELLENVTEIEEARCRLSELKVKGD